MALIWPWFVGQAIILVGILGLAASFESGEAKGFVGTGVFLAIALPLFVWQITNRRSRRS